MKIKSRRQKIRMTILLITLLLFPVLLNYLSPYLIMAGASEGVINGSLLVFSALFVAALVIGRGWCAWVCPAAGIGDICAMVQTKPVGKKTRWVKWGVWTVWLGMIVSLVVQAGGYQRVDPLYMSEEIVSVTHPEQYVIYYFVLASIVGLSLTVGKRGFCHTVCWMAPFMIIGRKLSNLMKAPALRLYADAGQCSDCLSCNRTCPMSLDVHQMVKLHNMEHLDCILCGQCVDGCSKQAIVYRFASPQIN